MHEDPTYISCLGGLMEGYVREKRAVGYKFTKGASLLRQLDLLIAKEQLEKIVLTKETVILWTRKRSNEKESTRIGRICLVRGFAEYMVRLGYEAYIFSKLATSLDRYSYVPYIFSKEEIRNVFIICDSYSISDFSPNRHLILPLLFRMLSI